MRKPLSQHPIADIKTGGDSKSRHVTLTLTELAKLDPARTKLPKSFVDAISIPTTTTRNTHKPHLHQKLHDKNREPEHDNFLIFNMDLDAEVQKVLVFIRSAGHQGESSFLTSLNHCTIAPPKRFVRTRTRPNKRVR